MQRVRKREATFAVAGAKIPDARRFVEALSGVALSDLIKNLDTELFLSEEGSVLLPTTRNDGDATCYICCPSVAYVDYAEEELRNLGAAPALRRAMAYLIGAAAPLVRAAGFDRQVQPNNWLFATNIACSLDLGGIARLTARTLDQYPDRAVVWRSLNDRSDRDALGHFAQAGYGLYPARQIYLFDCRAGQPRRSRDEARDLALLARTDHEIVAPQALRDTDFARIAALYGKLYLEKYTPLNPRYTAEFMARMHHAGILEFHGLRGRSGALDGVVGFFIQGNVMTAPVVGYDTGLDQSLGLYRRLMAIGLRLARQRGRLFNMSAGAASFKRNRGAIAAIEYTAVYNRHLPLKQRAAARVMRTVLNRVGVPLMRRFEL